MISAIRKNSSLYSGSRSCRPVQIKKTLLLDGFLGWSWRLEYMRRNLGAASCPAEIWHYNTSGREDLETMGARLADHIHARNEEVNLVGYSMGGLVIRTALMQRPELRVARAVFLHTPHQGTLLGHLLNLPAVRQMRTGSDFLKFLNAKPLKIPVLNAWCPGDLIVVPGWNARWLQAQEEICLWTPAHVWPLFSKSLHYRIGKFLVGSLKV